MMDKPRLSYPFPLWGKVGMGAAPPAIQTRPDHQAPPAPIPAFPQRGKEPEGENLCTTH